MLNLVGALITSLLLYFIVCSFTTFGHWEGKVVENKQRLKDVIGLNDAENIVAENKNLAELKEHNISLTKKILELESRLTIKYQEEKDYLWASYQKKTTSRKEG